MSAKSVYRSIHPIGDSDPQNMPVADAEQAATYYQQRMGFVIVLRQEAPIKSILLRRDDVELVLAENGGDPEQASCYIETSDVEQARTELQASGCEVSYLRNDTYGEASYRVFFVRAPDGLCYCLGQKQSE